ncbi:hypothetical protein [Methylocystis bryophila]|uniref:hypothetical protein n=1 Tax=Methylocystis bryophila TaxID=655015 RepID=UPI00131A08F4|nr:hypothetical protein [Methylocystis bryophila]
MASSEQTATLVWENGAVSIISGIISLWHLIVFAIFIFVVFYISYKRLKHLDIRVLSILFFTTLSLILSIALYKLGEGHGKETFIGSFRDPSTFNGSVFAGWCASLAFFLVIGLAVALASLDMPENKSFESRARILFRKQTGTHIEYILSKLSSMFEHYTERATVKVSVEEYDKTHKLFRICIEGESIIKSYIDDAETTYKSMLSLDSITTHPGASPRNMVIYLRVNGSTKHTCEFDNKIEREFQTLIPASETCTVTSKIRMWFKADDETYSNRPVRYTQQATLYIENILPEDQKIKVSFAKD